MGSWINRKPWDGAVHNPLHTAAGLTGYHTVAQHSNWSSAHTRHASLQRGCLSPQITSLLGDGAHVGESRTHECIVSIVSTYGHNARVYEARRSDGLHAASVCRCGVARGGMTCSVMKDAYSPSNTRAQRARTGRGAGVEADLLEHSAKVRRVGVLAVLIYSGPAILLL